MEIEYIQIYLNDLSDSTILAMAKTYNSLKTDLYYEFESIKDLRRSYNCSIIDGDEGLHLYNEDSPNDYGIKWVEDLNEFLSYLSPEWLEEYNRQYMQLTTKLGALL